LAVGEDGGEKEGGGGVCDGDGDGLTKEEYSIGNVEESREGVE